MENLTIVKVGGAVVEDDAQLEQLLDSFARIEGHKMLVHGGGRRATKVAASLGIESRMLNGRRITDRQMLDVVTMVYGGLVNKNIVARLEARGICALGLTGADLDIIRSRRRKPLAVNVEGETRIVDYGFVGDVERADGQQLARLIGGGIVPVVAPLTHDGQGNILNTNADTMASAVAQALAPLFNVTLMFAFEKKGVLANPDDDDSVIPLITPDIFRRLKADGTVSGGMLPKIENALAATEAGVERVVITLATALDGQQGTVIRRP